MIKLQCGHSVCEDSLGKYVKSTLESRRRVVCPVCRSKLCTDELKRVCPDVPLEDYDGDAEADALPAPAPRGFSGWLARQRERREARRYRRLARRQHMKQCP